MVLFFFLVISCIVLPLAIYFLSNYSLNSLNWKQSTDADFNKYHYTLESKHIIRELLEQARTNEGVGITPRELALATRLNINIVDTFINGNITQLSGESVYLLSGAIGASPEYLFFVTNQYIRIGFNPSITIILKRAFIRMLRNICENYYYYRRVCLFSFSFYKHLIIKHATICSHGNSVNIDKPLNIQDKEACINDRVNSTISIDYYVRFKNIFLEMFGRENIGLYCTGLARAPGRITILENKEIEECYSFIDELKKGGLLNNEW